MFRLLLGITLLPILLHAQTHTEVLGGGLTYHWFNPSGNDINYSNKLDSTGALIHNLMIGYREVDVKGVSYTSRTFFTGQNSIGQPMLGVAWSTGYIVNDTRVGLVGGVYFQDDDKMLERQVEPVMIIPHSGWAPVPVVGVEATHINKLTNRTYILLNVLLTPLFVNGTVGFGWEI